MSLPGGSNFSVDGAPVAAWLYFPGLKVGKIHLYSSFLAIFGGVDYKSLRSTEYVYS
jgi:hypothetical protein